MIYMDNHATTRVDPGVLERMLPTFGEDYGNASSRHHAFGWKAEKLVDKARKEVASLIAANAREILFVSGATEANNLALMGLAAVFGEGAAGKKHIITQATEHKAVLDVCAALEKRGFEIDVLPVDGQGELKGATAQDPVAAIAEKIRPDTLCVSVMAANNEVGTLFPIAAIGALCKSKGVFFHCDAAQGAGRMPLDVEAMGIDLLSLSAHKVYGPKGVGALYVRRKNPRVQLAAQILGGGHERGVRSGTLNVPGIVGLGAAAAIAKAQMVEENARIAGLRQTLWDGLCAEISGVVRNGPEFSRRHPGNLNIAIEGIESEDLILGLRDVALSSGAACASTDLEPSHVLRAMGISPKQSHASLRFGLGRFNTEAEVSQVIQSVAAAVSKVRERG